MSSHNATTTSNQLRPLTKNQGVAMQTQHNRLASSVGALSAAAFAVALGAPAIAAEVKYDPGDKVYFTYCYAHPPALRIKPGDSVITSTRDASNDAFSVSDTSVAPKLDLTKVNPQTGPFYIEGAEPGDTLEVRIDSI